MATPTYDDYQRELDLALEKLDKKEISYSDFIFIRRDLNQKMKELTPPPKEEIFDEIALERIDSPAIPIDFGTEEVPSIEEIMIDLPIKSDAPPIFPYEPKSDLPQVQKDFFQNRYSYYLIEQEQDRFTARESALKDLQQAFSVPTADYSTERGFESNIVDAEKGLVRDRETGQVRKADTLELFLEAFKRQRIGELPKVKEEREREIDRALSLLQQQVPTEDINLGDLPGPEDKDEYVSERVEEVITEPAKKLAGAVLTEEVPETGEIYESTLGAALRDIGLTFSGGAAATAQKGLSLFVDPNESDIYRLADSGTMVDQFITNVAKGQGIPELYAANPYGPASYIGNRVEGWTPEGVAWWLGVGMELPLPLTGIPLAVKTASKTARVVGRGLQKTGVKGLKETGAVLEGISNPAQAARYYATKSQINQMFDDVGVGKTTNEVIDDYYAGKFTWDDWLDAQAKQANLQEISADLIAERYATLASLNTLIRAGEDITVGDYLMRASHKGQPPPTALAVFEQAKVLDKPDTLLSNSAIKEIVDDQQYLLQRSAEIKQNKNLAVLHNKMKAMEDYSVEGIRAAIEGTAKPLRTSRLVNDFVNELQRTSAAYNLSRNVDIFEKLKTQKTGKPIIGQELDDLLTDASRSFDDTDFVFVVNEAMRNTLKGNIKETLLNKAPQDLTLIAGNVVIPTRVYKNKQLRKKFDDAAAKEREKINYSAKADVYVVEKKNIDDVIDMFIDYAGVNTIRQSKKMKDFLLDLNSKGQFSPRQYQEFVEPSIMNRAGKDMGAFRLQTGGKQAELAAVPQEFRGDIIAISQGQSLSEQLSKGQLGQFARAVRDLFKNESNVVVNPKEGFSPSPEFATTEKRINAKIEKVQENFEKEFLSESKKSDPITAMNLEMEKSYKTALAESERRIKATVQRGYRNDWQQYANDFDSEYYPQMKRVVEETGKSWEKVVLDFQLYFNHQDQWRVLLNGYFGSDYAKYYDPSKYRGLHARNVAKQLPPEEATGRQRSKYFEPTRENFLPITFDNFKLVIDRTQKNNSNLVPLRKPSLFGLGQEMPILVAQEWVLGMRQADVVADELLSFLDANPQFRFDLIPEYLASNMQTNLTPLINRYQEILDDLLRDIPDVFVDDPLSYKKILVKLIDDKVPNQLANLHFDLLTKVGIKERDTMINAIAGLMVETKTLYPNLMGIEKEFYKKLGIAVDTFNTETNKIFSSIEKTFKREGIDLPDEWQDILNTTRSNILDLFLRGAPVDGRYHADIGLGVINDAIESVREFFLANGIAVGDSIIDALDQNLPLLQKIRGTDSSLLFGPAYSNDASKLFDMAKANKLRTSVEKMRNANESLGNKVGYFFGKTIEFFRRTMSQGLLAGTYLPNIPYLAQNIVTAPLIMMGTLGARGGRATKFVPDAMTIGKQAPDRKVFTSRSGRVWTAQELRNLEQQYNLGLTRQKVEVYESTARQTMSQLGLDLSGQPLSKAQPFIDLVDPSRRNMYSKLADNSDYMYRRAAFYSALADDMPVEQAVDIAKRSLLDYGALGKLERDFAQKYVMFWSFTRQIHSELINAIYKGMVGDAGHNYIWKAMRASSRQQKDAGSWLYADDQSKARLYSMWADKIDGKDLYTFGYSNPYVESFETMTNLASILHPDTSMNQALDAMAKGARLRPVLNTILERMSGKYSTRVPPEDIVWLQTFGDFELYRDLFGITPLEKYKKTFQVQTRKDYTTSPRTRDERRAGEPVYGPGEQQYKMSKDGAKNYALWKIATLLLGINRAPRDYAKLYMAAIKEDADADYKRFGTPNLFLKALGAETSVSTKGEREIILRHQKEIERFLMENMKK